MTKLQLSADEYRLFIVIPEDGTSVGNVTARSKVGFAKGRYRTAKDGLLDKHLIVRARGGGGAIKRAAVAEGSDIEIDHVNGVATVKPPVAESKLYAPLLKTLSGSWGEDRGFTPITIEDVANLGRRETGGKWTRPDLVTVGVTVFDFVPTVLFDVITFEVKPADQVNVIAVYEALSHRRAATHAFVLIHVPSVLSDSMKKNVGVVVKTAAEHGIGVITFAEPDDYESWNTRVDAVRVDSPAEQVNSFVQRNISLEGQLLVADAVKRLRRGDSLNPVEEELLSNGHECSDGKGPEHQGLL